MPKKDQRNTRQRTAIRDTFEQAGRPLSPQQALEAAKEQVSGLGIATVYRNINALLREGWLAAIELPGAGTVYERAGKTHHHHFHCRACDTLFELPGCVLDLGKLAPRGFELEGHELFLQGLCEKCLGKPSAKPRNHRSGE